MTDKTEAAVKFEPAAAPVGGAKIEVGGAASSGDGGLLKFANDPSWVRQRWLLFVLFWATLLAVLVVGIAVEAPESPAAESRLWWEKGELLLVDVKQARGLDGLTESLGETHQFSNGILLDNVIKSDEFGVVDYDNVDEVVGDLTKFKIFIENAKSMGVKIVLGININHCSKNHPWFEKSAKKEDNFTDYFVWRDGNPDRRDEKPNNWISLDKEGGSAWELNADRNHYFLHQYKKTQPDLNLRNPDLLKRLQRTLRQWKVNGVSGFYFKSASYLVEDEDATDEPDASKPSRATFTDYAFYDHTYTKNLADNVQLLSVFKDELVSEMDEPENKIIFAAELVGSAAEVKQYYGETRPPVVELPLWRVASASAKSADILDEAVHLWLKNVPAGVWPNWLLDTKRADRGALAMLLALLPGTFVYEPGAELHTPRIYDSFAVMKRVQPEREAPSITHGGTDIKVFNKFVFGYTRTKSGSPGYMVLFNMGPSSVTVDVTVFSDIAEELTLVQCHPAPTEGDDYPLKSKFKSTGVPVASSSTVVMTFVPQKH